jgi:hypothetical protein
MMALHLNPIHVKESQGSPVQFFVTPYLIFFRSKDLCPIPFYRKRDKTSILFSLQLPSMAYSTPAKTHPLLHATIIENRAVQNILHFFRHQTSFDNNSLLPLLPKHHHHLMISITQVHPCQLHTFAILIGSWILFSKHDEHFISSSFLDSLNITSHSIVSLSIFLRICLTSLQTCLLNINSFLVSQILLNTTVEIIFVLYIFSFCSHFDATKI